MRFRFLPVMLALTLAVPLAAQDTTAVKSLTASTKRDVDSIALNPKLNLRSQRAMARIRARQDSIVTAAKKPAPTPFPNYTVTDIALSGYTTPIKIGQSTTVVADAKNASGGSVPRVVFFSVDSARIAIVDSVSGTVTGRAVGTVNVAAKVDTIVRRVTIQVIDSATVVITPPPSTTVVAKVDIRPNTGTFAIGTPITFTGIPRDAANNALLVPVSWSSNPQGINGLGVLTPTAIGTVAITAKADTAVRTITIQIVAATSIDTTVVVTPPPVNPPPPVAGFDGPAELPRGIPSIPAPTCTTTVRLLAGADLQATLNTAQPGVCILLAPGSTFVTSSGYVLPNKGTSTSYITIQSDVTLPATGTRMTPTQAASLNLAKIQTSAYAPALRTASGAHHYIVRGVEIGTTAAAQATTVNMLVDFRDQAATWSLAGVPHDLWLIQNYVHGTPTLDIRRLWFNDSRNSGGVGNWFADAHSNNSDSQCWLLFSGARNQLYQNNHCEGGHEPFMSGGGDPPDSTMQPSDVAIINNHFYRPLAWKGVWQVKNMLEDKNIRRELVEGNVFENSWPDAQAGFCFVMKGENQNGTAPWSTSSDITIRYNLIRGCANGFNISGRGTAGPTTYPSSRFSIHHNYVDDLAKNGGDGIAVQSLNDVTDEVYRSNTFLNGLQGFPSNMAISLDGTPAVRPIIDSTIFGHGAYGVKGSGGGDGISSLNLFMPGVKFTNNAIVSPPSGGACTNYPATTVCPGSTSGLLMGVSLSFIQSKTAGVVVLDPLSLRRSAPRRGQLKYGIPTTDPKCHQAAKYPLDALKCDVPLKP